MAKDRKFNRRDFLKLSGSVAAAAAAGGLTAKKRAFAVPNIIRQRDPITLAVGGWAVDSITDILADLEFTEQTGIEVDVVTRPGTVNEMITQMASAVQADTSPYDVFDFEDGIAVTMSRAGWLRGLDDLLPSDFWEDWPESMLEMTEIWDRYQGETFRIHHNYECCYYWHRKDWFDEAGVSVPTNWDEVAALGEVFTDRDAGVWATEDGMGPASSMNVYLAWITRQAGGNSFDLGEEFRTALAYIYELMHSDNALNPASMQKDYDQLNADYMADRVAFMRQWPFLYDVARADEEWFEPDKAVITLPPAGPNGPKTSTYAAGWGWGIPRTTEHPEEAAELLKFLVDKENAAKMVEYSVWYLSARHSVLEAAGDEGLPAALKMYSDAGVITTRPFHEKFVEAFTILDEGAKAYFTDQISLEDALSQMRSRMERL